MGPSKEHILLLTNTYLHEHKAQFWINRNTQSGHIGLEEHRTQNGREKKPISTFYKNKKYLHRETLFSGNLTNITCFN